MGRNNGNTSALVRKDQIIKVATELFNNQGYDNTSIRTLAKAVDINIASIYYYFKDKEDILFHIIDNSLNKLINSLKNVIKVNNKPQDNLTSIVRVFMQVNWENKSEIGLLFKESHRLRPKQLAITNKKQLKILRMIIKELQKLHDEGRIRSQNLTVIAQSLFAMTNWSIFWINPKGALTLQDITEEIIGLWFHGFLDKSS